MTDARPEKHPPEPESAEEGLWLNEENFVTQGLPSGRVRLPGPGLPESLAWVGGIFAFQIFAALLMGMVLVVVYLANGGEIRDLTQPEFVESVQEDSAALLFGGIQTFLVLGVMLAVGLRLGRDFRRRLPLTAISWRHCLLILLLFFPLALVSGQLYVWSRAVWQEVLRHAPQLEMLDGFDAMPFLQSLAEQAPLPVMLMIIAVAPAVWEELVFRGVIGRGLLARWGLPAGVLMTSFLFAIMHLHPAHAAALVPLAVVIHLLHIATRSFWAPVALHFLNNGLAVVLIKYPPPVDIQGLADDQPLEPSLFVAAVLCAIALVHLIWRTRVQYHRPDGTVWSPGYVSVELPPREVQAVASPERAGGWAFSLAAVGILAFVAALVYSALGN